MADSAALLARLSASYKTFNINVSESGSALCVTLDSISAQLACSHNLRVSLGSGKPSLWPCLRRLWQSLHRAQLTFWDYDSDGNTDCPAVEASKHRHLILLCLSVARFTRNIVAGVQHNQNEAYENEVEIRRLLHYYTSWTAMEDQESVVVARVLAQTLSNLVTSNQELMSTLWETYMNLPEDQVVLIRLLTSTDGKLTVPALVLIQNCIQGSQMRAKRLVRSVAGMRMCILLLDRMAQTYEAEEGTDDAQVFDIGYTIFTRLSEAGLVPELYTKLTIPDEVVTPNQTVLLKLVDSYLQATPAVASDIKTSRLQRSLSELLGSCFLSMSAYSRKALRRSLGSPSSETFPQNGTPPAELDVMLPKVCEALVLVSQCIVTITLDNETDPATPKSTPEQSLKTFFNDLRSEGHFLSESLVGMWLSTPRLYSNLTQELLRLLDRFLPRINFGKPVVSPANEASHSSTSVDGFSYLKRDLVRLLGVLCHQDKSVQDRVRECGGIEVVMNLCVVDERNPFLREHAIFTLHNLLQANPDNQAIVQEVQPASHWDEDGVLKNTSVTK